MKNFFKQEKGINLISLTITITVILIVTGMLIFNADDSVKMEKLQNMYNDISNLREKISVYYKKYGAIPGKYEFTSIENLESAGVIGANDTGKFYIIDLKVLPSLTLNYGKDYYRAEEENVDVNTLKDVYIINETSHNIFYVQGISIKVNDHTKIYYTDETDIDTAEVEIKNTPNAPNLSQGMIPIKWENGNWIICSEDDPEWYEYVDQKNGVDKTSKWANVMLSDGIYKSGTEKTENARKNKTPIKETELGSMFVWIPRYAYQIESLYHKDSESSGGIVNIEFLEGTKEYNTGDNIKSGKLVNKSGKGNWNEHPAFTFGNKILSGIWVAKFEASSTTTTPDENHGGGNVTNLNIKVLPGKAAWREISASNMFTNCVNMNNEQNANIYGISQKDNEIDPHLMKNDEWGAVAYLTQSSYGRNGHEVTPNTNGYGSYKYIYTGYAGDGTAASNPGDGVSKPTNVYYYNTEKGMLASTTGNITGIFDMNGGSWETVAAYIDNGDESLKKQEVLLNADPKYKNVYKAIKADGSEATSGDDEPGKSYEAAESIYGDAMWETSKSQNGRIYGWYKDNSAYAYGVHPLFLRGGSYYFGKQSGLFKFYDNVGSGWGHHGFRPVLAVY